MTIKINKGAYPGLYRLELDTGHVDDEFGNYRFNPYQYSCWKEDDNNCNIREGDDIFYEYIRIINTRIEAPEEDY